MFAWLAAIQFRRSQHLPRVLFLDDDPCRAQVFLETCPQAVWVETAEACLEQLADPWDEIHLDHDLGGDVFVDSARPDCGMEVVRWLSASDRRHLRNCWFVVHTHNPDAAYRMYWSLRIRGYRAELRPFGVPPLPPEPETDGPRWLDAIRGLLRGRRGSIVRDQADPPSR